MFYAAALLPRDHHFEVFTGNHQRIRPRRIAGFEQLQQVGVKLRLPVAVQRREGLVRRSVVGAEDLDPVGRGAEAEVERPARAADVGGVGAEQLDEIRFIAPPQRRAQAGRGRYVGADHAEQFADPAGWRACATAMSAARLLSCMNTPSARGRSRNSASKSGCPARRCTSGSCSSSANRRCTTSRTGASRWVRACCARPAEPLPRSRSMSATNRKPRFRVPSSAWSDCRPRPGVAAPGEKAFS
ncbi:hypothetical protein ebA6470 [Aromatoleum aromaticum EbN1]|uniref:Uncharacterized protein n=1 Tax=Aromatoleum aromaticum (strain DSM 19018 / LMG 30748 / EbN1) TaxID=76114 RepID=Q5NYN9_AROAE|nr:hypothetical protein ebA6470 [Aromatoleum aromaticum EbN1]